MFVFCAFAFLDLLSVLAFVPNHSVILCSHTSTWCGKKWPEMFCNMPKPHSPKLNVSCWVLRCKRTSLCKLCFDFPVKVEHSRLQCCAQPLHCRAFLFLLCSSFICLDLACPLEEKFFTGPGRHHHSGSCHLALKVPSLCPARNWITYAITFQLPPAGTGKRGGKAGTGFTFSG